jgi:predicted O-methyltransferase YrrM
MVIEYQFTENWFVNHLPIWRAIFSKYLPKRILEVGSFEGRSAAYIIEECLSLTEIVCIDTWEDYPGMDWQFANVRMSVVERRFDDNMIVARRRRETPIDFRKIKDRSAHALATLVAQREAFDLVYIDGSHMALDVLTDAVFGFQLLRPGGVLIFDDYLWRDKDTDGRDILYAPKAAIDAFTNLGRRSHHPTRRAAAGDWPKSTTPPPSPRASSGAICKISQQRSTSRRAARIVLTRLLRRSCGHGLAVSRDMRGGFAQSGHPDMGRGLTARAALSEGFR